MGPATMHDPVSDDFRETTALWRFSLAVFSHTPSTVMPRHEVVKCSRDAADLVKTYPSKTLWDKSYGKEKEYLQVPRPSHPLKVGALLS